jgi:hypothetical protein
MRFACDRPTYTSAGWRFKYELYQQHDGENFTGGIA